MKQNLQITLTVLSGIILSGLLTGCTIPTTKEDITKSATEYNLVAEKAGNEMLLLNIVRASKRRPMYFTSFGKLTRNMSFEVGTGSIDVPFDKFAEGFIHPTAKYSNSPFFDLAVLDTQEFTNGIMKAVPMSTIEYYWSQGWHKEMLLHLFIRRIVIKDKEGNVKDEYLNYPGDQDEFEKFQKYIQLKDWEWDIEEKVIVRSTEEFGENEPKQLKDLKEMMEAQKAGLTLTPVKENNKVQQKSNDEKENKTKLCLSKVEYFFTRVNRLDKEQKETFDKTKGTIYLRSPEAILYYLGEILRTEIPGERKGKTNPNIPIIYAGLGNCEGTKNWLFYAREKKCEDVNPCVSVDYEGTKYVIPGRSDSKKGCCKDRSMHVLSLVSLLIGQQKKSSEIPTTATVSVIGR